MNAKFCWCALCFLTSNALAAERPQLGLLLPPVFPKDPQLTWQNGERLTGTLTSAQASELLWTGSLFPAPVRLRLTELARVEFPQPKDHPQPGEFRLVLLDGSNLEGHLTSLTPTALGFQTTLGPALTVAWEQVVTVERTSGGGVMRSGPSLLVKAPPAKSNNDNNNNQPALIPWYYATGGQAVTPAYQQSVAQPVAVPARSLLEVAFTSLGAPAFAIGLQDHGRSAAVEMWGDELVLVEGARFASAGVRYAEQDRQVHWRLGWDRQQHASTLYGPDGQVWASLAAQPPLAPVSLLRNEALLWASWDLLRRPVIVPPPARSQSLQWHNHGLGMRVQRLTISEWSGAAPPTLVAAPSSIETATEQILGTPTGLHDGLLVIQLGEQTRELPLTEMRSLRWAREPQSSNDPLRTSLWFADGQFLRGELQAIKDGQIRLQTNFTPEPLTISLASARTLLWPNPPVEGPVPTGKAWERALAQLDTVTTSKGTLHGNIVWGGGAFPQFTPTGGLEPVSLLTTDGLTLTRAMAAHQPPDQPPTLLHLRSAETIPVQLTGVSKTEIEGTFAGTEAHRVPTAQLHAIQFTMPGQDLSFEGPGWESLSAGWSDFHSATVALPGGAGIAHPFALQGDDVRWKIKPRGDAGTLRVRLFTSDGEAKEQGLSFLIASFSNSFYCGKETGEGQLNTRTDVPSKGEWAEVRLGITPTSAQMFVNDVRVAEAQRDPKNLNTGIVLQSTSIWGNQMREVTLSDFSSTGFSSQAGPPRFTEEAKREALLLPRVHRESPPRQVLIGRNGDLLRGEIESMTSTHFLFRAGMENFKVPLERVAAAVWLTKDSPKEKDAKEKDAKEDKAAPIPSQWLDLTNGGRIELRELEWTAEQVMGTHAMLGKMRLPVGLVQRVTTKPPALTAGYAALANWKLINTPDPVLPEAEGTSSPLVGKAAADFKLPMLDVGEFSLKKMAGKVVVLDFWATWCGPCVKSLPDLIAAMQAFPEDKVTFLAVNQGETKAQVAQFLTTRGFQMPVGLDATQAVAKKYGVDGIPHTVVIGRDGKITLVKTGYSPEGAQEISAAVHQALE